MTALPRKSTPKFYAGAFNADRAADPLRFPITVTVPQRSSCRLMIAGADQALLTLERQSYLDPGGRGLGHNDADGCAAGGVGAFGLGLPPLCQGAILRSLSHGEDDYLALHEQGEVAFRSGHARRLEEDRSDFHPLARLGVWDRLLAMAQAGGVELGKAFLDSASIRVHAKTVGAFKKEGLR